jgi:hypothetical protein
MQPTCAAMALGECPHHHPKSTGLHHTAMAIKGQSGLKGHHGPEGLETLNASSDQVRFGKDAPPKIDPPPKNVPADLQKRWYDAKFPQCCRTFYTSPGPNTCCAGQTRPNGTMALDPWIVRVLRAVVRFIRHFVSGLARDLKTIFVEPKTKPTKAQTNA